MKKTGSDPEEKKHIVSLEPREVMVESQDKKFLKKFLNIVEKKLSDPELDIDVIAEKLKISRSTLYRKIKTITKDSPQQFIQSHRLDLAKQFLENNAGNVTYVAEKVGFSDQPNFSKYFKRKFGISPKKYQEQCKENTSKTKEKTTKNITNSHPKEVNIYLKFSLDDLDRAYISKIQATKSEHMYDFEDKEGTPQRYLALQRIENLYKTPISLASDHPLVNYTLKELLQKMNKEIEKGSKKARDISPLSGYTNERFDLYDITDSSLIRNAGSVAAVCMLKDLQLSGSGCFKLLTKNYGKTFNLCVTEPFYQQPTAAGRLYTGILVGEDIIVTTAHMVNEKNVTDIRFVFGFAIQKTGQPAEKIPKENIYQGVEILQQVHNSGEALALIKLDRKVTDRKFADLSQTGIYKGQPVYVIGHPCGLPLKYAPGLSIADVSDNYFTTELDIYSGCIGSPVFCALTHKLVGIISQSYTPDFRWTGKGWITLRYPKTGSNFQGSQCIVSSHFNQFVF
ncbi:MAG TPA: helix-turn-helix domain-containing protein [Candidatus Deferrimicrobium sp.]|nr:helix-turn-helix domain-containing protein [Candidatus Kapabacteria bacterium]HLP60915.1 helix-turn-helix domain-containing protein [Candidatus Deferrimicrobium sp.]